MSYDQTRPGIVWSANGEAGDSTGRCELCGEELDEPHSWEECARASAAHNLATLDLMIDVEVRAEQAEALLLKVELGGTSNGNSACCPWCGGGEPYHGDRGQHATHRADCEFEAWKREAAIR